MKRNLITIFTIGVIMLIAATPACATDLIIQPDSPAGKDAFVSRAEPDNNYGTHENLIMGLYRNNWDNEHRSFIRFGLSGIPLGSTISSARLYLYHCGHENGYYYATFGAHRVTENWAETYLTWNNQPDFDAAEESSNFFSRYHPFPDWHEWNLICLLLIEHLFLICR